MSYSLFLSALGFILPIGVAMAQEDDARVVTKVIGVQNLRVDEAVGLIEEMYGGELYSWAAVQGTGRVVLRGEQSVVDNALNLIREVDVEDAAQESLDEVTEYLPVRTYPMERVTPLLQGLNVNMRRLNAAVDHVNRQLILTGEKNEVGAVKQLLAQVDQPESTLALHFFFIHSAVGPASDPEYLDLPESLLPTAKALVENGFENPKLMGLLIVRANSTQEFESNWAQDQEVDGAQRLQFNLKGTAQVQRGSDTVQLGVTAQMRGHRATRDQPVATVFELESTLSVKLGSYVVLAAAPSTTESGSAIALAVRVTQD
jgi:hypothetical protein